MKFPETLTHKDMLMRIKEWRLAGFDVYTYHMVQEVEVKGEGFFVTYTRAKKGKSSTRWKREQYENPV